jgi:hypothetical protein
MMSGSRNGKPMQTWGDLNLALNGLVREGAIAGFRTKAPWLSIDLQGARYRLARARHSSIRRASAGR